MRLDARSQRLLDHLPCRVLAGQRLGASHLLDAGPTSRQLLGALAHARAGLSGAAPGRLGHAHRRLMSPWPVASSCWVTRPVSGGEPLTIVTMVAISLR